jgi:CBS domain-containing protein
LQEPTVLQAKRYGIYSCAASDTLRSAAWRIVDEYISALVVLDEAGRLAGVITRTDLLRARQEHESWATKTVGEFMSANVVTVPVDARLPQVRQLMTEHRIHRVVVVDDDKKPVAVISTADLVYHMTKMVPRPQS